MTKNISRPMTTDTNCVNVRSGSEDAVIARLMVDMKKAISSISKPFRPIAFPVRMYTHITTPSSKMERRAVTVTFVPIPRISCTTARI